MAPLLQTVCSPLYQQLGVGDRKTSVGSEVLRSLLAATLLFLLPWICLGFGVCAEVLSVVLGALGDTRMSPLLTVRTALQLAALPRFYLDAFSPRALESPKQDVRLVRTERVTAGGGEAALLSGYDVSGAYKRVPADVAAVT